MKAISFQTALFNNDVDVIEKNYDKYSGTFSKSMSQYIHNWYRYSAGFSSEWVNEVIYREKKKGRTHVLDPFAGSGTVLLESEKCGVLSIGIESHPYIARIAKAKLQWRENPEQFKKYANIIIEQSEKLKPNIDHYPALIKKCYPTDILERLDVLRQSVLLNDDNSPISELTWLALASILRSCSPVGTAQWTYVLPNKSKAKVIDPYDAFCSKVKLMAKNMVSMQKVATSSSATLFQEDARECNSVPNNWASLIITSPPYANNYDYADATRLELCFFGEIRGWGDLQSTIRKHLIRSCTQHISPISKDTYKMIESPVLKPIRDELYEICKNLDEEKKNHGGKKQYSTMVAAYFLDLANVWLTLRRVTSDNALACFVIGDSAPYGIYVPVDRWLGDLAINAGFASYEFEKIRDRNVKWKNRKHRVPLHEGRLWVK
jgi:DNA modification methylase